MNTRVLRRFWLLFLLFPTLVDATSIQVFSRANILDVENQRILENHFFVLEDEKIAFIGEALPEQYKGISHLDLGGAYVMPGLIDTHAHISLGATNFKKERGMLLIHASSSDEMALWNAERMLKWGVTTIRNPGGSTKANLRYKRQVAESHWQGPRAYVAGNILNSLPFSGLVAYVSDKPSIEAEIKRQHDAGVDFIKLYTGLSHEQLEQAIHISKSYGLPTIGHLERVSWAEAAKMGIDNLVHAFPVSSDLLTGENRMRFETQGRPGTFTLFEWYEAVDFNSKPMQELFITLRNYNVSVDPTLVVFKNTFFANSDEVTAHPKLDLVHPELIANWKDLFNFNTGWHAADYQRAQKVWPKVLELTRLLHQNGVMLTVGTDAANPWVIPGFSMHQEMQLFVDAGISNWDVLQMSTLNGAKLISKQAELGSLAPGKLADFIILEANPADNIQHAQRIVSVYQNGKLIHSSN